MDHLVYLRFRITPVYFTALSGIVTVCFVRAKSTIFIRNLVLQLIVLHEGC
jgi:hypothetical protein